MNLTPRQIDAYLEFAEKIRRIERANELTIIAVGSQGDQKTRDQLFKTLIK